MVDEATYLSRFHIDDESFDPRADFPEEHKRNAVSDISLVQGTARRVKHTREVAAEEQGEIIRLNWIRAGELLHQLSRECNHCYHASQANSLVPALIPRVHRRGRLHRRSRSGCSSHGLVDDSGRFQAFVFCLYS